MLSTDSPTALLATSIRTYITASHILHHNSVLDAYGHLSFRNPTNPDTFLMSRSIAPATISSPEDVLEYHVSDASPVFPTSSQGYAERHIHSEIYKRHPSVKAAVHSHSEAVVPFTISGVPLRPCYHMAGFIPATGAPVFEISEFYSQGEEREVRDMLVKNERLGAALAKCFDDGVAVALMRGHGFTVVAEGGMEEVVLRAVYTQKNAAIQTSALMLGMAYNAAGGGGGVAGEVRYLDEEEAKGATEMTRWSAQRPWNLWVKEVEANGLYVNSA